MIAGLALALQLAAATTPAVVNVRAGTAEAVVKVAQTNTGPAVALAEMAPVTPVAVRATGLGRWTASIAGIELELREQVPYARIGGVVVPLAGSPHLHRDQLYVPLHVITHAVPRASNGRVRWNPTRSELRVMGEPEQAPVLQARGGSSAAQQPARAASTPAPAAATPRRTTTPTRRRRVVVDAGHGGPDAGMSGPIGSHGFRIHEKDVTLAVAKRVETALKARGVDVIMTRTKDTLIALSDRGKIANEAHGDLFLSIHVNAANPNWRTPGGARGFETYFLAEAKTEDARRVAQMENESVRFETEAHASSSRDPLSFIIADMAQNEHLRESSELAELVQHRLSGIHPGPNRGVKQAGFRVLVTAFMPAVLIELGFGTNPDEARYLADARRQQEMANAIADAALDYLNRYERRLGNGDGR